MSTCTNSIFILSPYLQILLPFSVLVVVEGPLDQPATSITGTVDPIQITVSPPIVRLVIHAVKTLMPTKV